MSLETTLTALVDEMKRLNDNIEEKNNLEINRQVCAGDLEMEQVADLDS